jgi:hypothetical protein
MLADNIQQIDSAPWRTLLIPSTPPKARYNNCCDAFFFFLNKVDGQCSTVSELWANCEHEMSRRRDQLINHKVAHPALSPRVLRPEIS